MQYTYQAQSGITRAASGQRLHHGFRMIAKASLYSNSNFLHLIDYLLVKRIDKEGTFGLESQLPETADDDYFEELDNPRFLPPLPPVTTLRDVTNTSP